MNLKFHDRLGFRIAAYLAGILTVLLFCVAAWIIRDESAHDRDSSINSGRIAALSGAAAYAHALEQGVDNGDINMHDLLEPTYMPIFWPGRVKQPEHTRYHTKYDWYTDRHIAALQDAIVESSIDFTYATGIARGGYVPTPNWRYSLDPTGISWIDKLLSRKKQKYETELHRAAADFRGDPATHTFVQEYPRDSGGLVYDVAAPIYVHGQHFGAFRVGVSFTSIEARRMERAAAIMSVCGCITMFVAALLCAIVMLMMRPLVRLTRRAYDLSQCDDWVFDARIHIEGIGEISVMAEAVEAMRLGLRAFYRSISNKR